MMSLNGGLKSALLALTVMVVAPAQQMRASTAPNPVLDFVLEHKIKCAVTAACMFWFNADLGTKDSRDKFELKGFKVDSQEFLDALKNLDPSALKKFVALIRNYLIGFPIKFDNIDIPVSDEDGKYKKYTIRRKKKLVQSPSGGYGLFHAYVLSQIKDFTGDHIPQLMGLYAVIMHPELFFGNVFGKSTGAK